jgi:hypothetical protein
LCHIFCAKAKLENPVYTLKSPWVRPEDIPFLFEAGATHIKLAGRTQTSDWILQASSMYCQNKYTGNIWPYIEKSGLTSPDWNKLLNKKIPASHFSVRNEALDGFITPFLQGDVPCIKNQGSCGNCTWCQKWMCAVGFPENGYEKLTDIQMLLKTIGSMKTDNPLCCSN